MKALKITLGSLIGVTLIFLSVGLLFPSYQYQTSVVVNATPQKCWTIFHDTATMRQWLPGFESLTLKRGELLSNGSVYEIVVTDDDHRMVMEEKITAVTPPSLISYELTNDVLKSVHSFSFESTSPTTTRVSSNYEIKGTNMLWRSILFLSKSYMYSSAQEQLEGFKKVVERP